MTDRRPMDVDKLLKRPINRKTREDWRKLFAWFARQLDNKRQRVKTIVISNTVWEHWVHARSVLERLLREAFPDAVLVHEENGICKA